jgi:hypothetical protein
VGAGFNGEAPFLHGLFDAAVVYAEWWVLRLGWVWLMSDFF